MTMWNIDIETRIRDLNAEAENRRARLLDTMTETDGSAKDRPLGDSTIVQRIKQALCALRHRSRAVFSRPIWTISESQ
jgi:hypothetical protein